MFTKYSSIANATMKELKETLDSEYANEKWYVTEKIHGSNLSIIVDRNEEKIAKRSSILEKTTNFFNVSEKEDILKSFGRKIFTYLYYGLDVNIEYISIFGEWFGGYYPHEDVKQIPNRKKVQKGIAYSNDLHFAPFDILINGEFFVSKWVAYASFNIIMLKNEEFKNHIIMLDILKEGTLEECLDYDINFNSTIPKKLGLPEIKPNLAEGIVIKYSGDRKKERSKSFKKKNQKFSERQKVKKHNPTENFKPEELEYINFCKSCATENRVKNIISKIGEVDFKDFGNIMKNTVEDIHKEAKNEIPEVYNALDKKERRNANSFINRPLAGIIRSVLTDLENEI